MKEDVKLVDLVIELVDARAPLASRNPDIDSLAAGKGRVILFKQRQISLLRRQTRRGSLTLRARVSRS